jgi:hypothetical protein
MGDIVQDFVTYRFYVEQLKIVTSRSSNSPTSATKHLNCEAAQTSLSMPELPRQENETKPIEALGTKNGKTTKRNSWRFTLFARKKRRTNKSDLMEQ